MGASYHYTPPSEFAEADPDLVRTGAAAPATVGPDSVIGPSWTTDAPFRETAEAIEAARCKGILAVEMEASALYCFARATGVRVLCLAHVTTTRGLAGDDFEKGEADGATDALVVLETVATDLRSPRS
jgi:purine-nucleoside phosphorylase